MAIFHCSVKIIGRSTGRSAVAAAAYRSGEKLMDERQGITHDYTRKGGVIHSQIILPKHAPAEYRNRETLWNAVEKAEEDGKAQLAREVEVALPVELDYRESVVLLREYVQNAFVSQGMVADIAIHDKGDGNPHAHIMLTLRPMDEAGKWQNKAEKVYLCRNRQGQEQGFTANELRTLPAGEWEKQLPYYKNGKGKPLYLTKSMAETDNRYSDFIRVKGKNNPKKTKHAKFNATLEKWNDSGNVEIWREQWAVLCNRQLKKKGIALLDHRSYQRQNKVQTATIHLGKDATALERRGIKTELGKYNDEVRAENKEYQEGVRALRQLVDELKAEKEQQRTNRAKSAQEAHIGRQGDASDVGQVQPPRLPTWQKEYNEMRRKQEREATRPSHEAEHISIDDIAIGDRRKPLDAVSETGVKPSTSTRQSVYGGNAGAREGVQASDMAGISNKAAKQRGESWQEDARSWVEPDIRADEGLEYAEQAADPLSELAMSSERSVGGSQGTSVALEHQEPLQELSEPSEGMAEDVPVEETTEQVAVRLLGLGDKYISLAVEVVQAKRKEKNLLEDREYYKHAPDRIASRVNDIVRMQKEKAELEGQLGKLGLFSGRKKRELGERIQKVSQRLEAESGRYLRDYNNRQPAEAIEHAKQNELSLEAEIRELPDIGDIARARDTARQEYMREVELAFRREDGKQISELIKRGKSGKQSKEKVHLDDMIADAEARSNMRNFEIKTAKQVGIICRSRSRGISR